MDSELFNQMAEVYDSMIDWDKRLPRELPFIREIFKGKKKLLEIGCATGRHAIALSDNFKVIGIDINDRMIEIARDNATKMRSNAEFIKINAADINIDDERLKNVDGTYILANSLANFETEDNVVAFLKKLRELMPKGIIIGQTVMLKDEINYLPLRSVEEQNIIVQRIMFPVNDRKEYESSHILHFNVLKDGEYLNRSLLPLFGFTMKRLERVCKISGWKIKSIYGSYDRKPVIHETGKALVWVLA